MFAPAGMGLGRQLPSRNGKVAPMEPSSWMMSRGSAMNPKVPSPLCAPTAINQLALCSIKWRPLTAGFLGDRQFIGVGRAVLVVAHDLPGLEGRVVRSGRDVRRDQQVGLGRYKATRQNDSEGDDRYPVLFHLGLHSKPRRVSDSGLRAALSGPSKSVARFPGDLCHDNRSAEGRTLAAPMQCRGVSDRFGVHKTVSLGDHSKLMTHRHPEKRHVDRAAGVGSPR